MACSLSSHMTGVVAPTDNNHALANPSVAADPKPAPPPTTSTPNEPKPDTRPTIPPFYFMFGKPVPPAEIEEKNRKIQVIVKHLYGLRSFLLEPHFVAVTKTCGLPRYMNIAFFRRIDSLNSREERVSFDEFVHGWETLSRDRYDDASLFFNILKKPDCNWLLPEDFLPVLEDVVLNHRSLRFLADNPIFQERYIETVICRLYYEGRCPSGKMTLAQFRKSGFTEMILALGPNVDLNNTRDCFSYQHFYVLYCKFWTLDDDHDLIISESNLTKYNQAALTPRAVRRVMQCGRIAAFARDQATSFWNTAPTLTYLDYIWFLLSEIDKSTPMAIEYWFRCMDTDSDGVLSSFELAQFWQEQEARQRFYGVAEDDQIRLDNILCQMNDLIRPAVPGQFRLQDLKRNGYLAERFFDTFLNFDRFQIHESYQGSIRAKRKQDMQRRGQLLAEEPLSAASEEEISLLDDSLAYSLLSDWCEFADAEYQQLLLSDSNDAVWDDQEGDEEEEEDEDEDEEEEEEEEDDEEEGDEAEDEEDEDEDEEVEEPYDKHEESNLVRPNATVNPCAKGNDIIDLQSEGQDQEHVHAISREPESASDHDSDTSAPTTPTKDPSQQTPDWNTGGKPVESTESSLVRQESWLWQPSEEEEDSEEEREDRAAEWIWWHSRQRIPGPTCFDA